VRRHWIGVVFLGVMLAGSIGLGLQSVRLEQERERARLVSHLVPELFAGVAVQEALERNLPLLRAHYANQPLVWAELLSAGAHAYQQAGDLPRARALFEEALAIRRRELGGGHPTVLETRAHLEAAR
jgi:peptidoglycan/LPS O-acetylase OafA/YrhL